MVAVAACGGSARTGEEKPVRVIDLLHELPRAEKRPSGAAFELAEHTFSSATRATLAAPAPSRVIWTLHFPARGELRTYLAVTAPPGADAEVNFRIGISDDRFYEGLAEQRVTASQTRASGWVPLSVDLSLYGGRKWSLFYRPDSRTWQLIFNADQASGQPRALWGAPGVDADVSAAREWNRRRFARRDPG
jgi:hypothetical protein